jgi:hypothetical protein
MRLAQERAPSPGWKGSSWQYFAKRDFTLKNFDWKYENWFARRTRNCNAEGALLKWCHPVSSIKQSKMQRETEVLMWLGYGQTMAVVCDRLKTWLVLCKFLRDLPGVSVVLTLLFCLAHNCRQQLKPSTKLGRTSIEKLINYNATTLPLSSTLGDKVVLQNRIIAWLLSLANSITSSIQKSKDQLNNRSTARASTKSGVKG